MTVVYYSSQDASAPTLSGQSGSLVAVLTACLVDGYGAKAAAGWALEFTATNKGVYRAASGNRFRLRVDDTGVQEARISGFETMSSVDAGVNQFPTGGQQPGGLFVRKSGAASSASRAWILVADEKTFYFLSDSSIGGGSTGTMLQSYSGQAQNLSGGFGFGEFTSFKAGDAYNTFITGATSTGDAKGVMGRHTPGTTGSFSPDDTIYIARPFYQSGAAVQSGRWTPLAFNQQSLLGNVSSMLPDQITGAFLFSPIYLVEGINGNAAARGFLRGIWGPLHFNAQLKQAVGSTITGSGELASKTFLLAPVHNFQLGGGDSSVGTVGLEISDSWSA